MTRASLRFFFVILTALLVVAPASTVHAQGEEARLLFERGNQHLASGMRARGARRTRELQEALDAYLGVLRLGARTRNVVFNLALTLQELGREAEAFNYYGQYLREFELSDVDRAAGRERMQAIRGRVAVATVTSTPAGAEVRVDRRDLPVRGTTPLELALTPGEHTLFFALAGFEGTSAPATFAIGQDATVSVELTGLPVAVQFIAPGGGRLTLDGQEISAGHALPVAPGAHIVRLELPNAAPVERRFEVQPGADPMAINLSGGTASAARVTLEVDVEAQAYLDGLPMGQGRRIEFPALPGDHLLRVEADGRNRVQYRFTLTPEQALALDVSMGQHVNSGGLDAGRWVALSLTVAGLLGSSLATVEAFELKSEFDELTSAMMNGGRTEQEMQDLADEIELAALGADVLWGLTAVAGGISILLFAIDPGENVASTVEFAAMPLPGGGGLSVRGSF